MVMIKTTKTQMVLLKPFKPQVLLGNLGLKFGQNSLKFCQNLTLKFCQKPFESQMVLPMISGQKIPNYECGSPMCVVGINRGERVELKPSHLALSLIYMIISTTINTRKSNTNPSTHLDGFSI